VTDAQYQSCPECGHPKRRYMACTHCGYSYLQTIQKPQRKAVKEEIRSDIADFQSCPQCGKPKRRYVACTHCGYSYRQTTPESLTKKNAREARTEWSARETHAVSHGNRSRQVGGGLAKRPAAITVYDRGRRVSESKNCESCKQLSKPVWRFWETDRGMVYLCADCTKRAREHSRKTDAMDYRVPGDFFRG